MPTYCRRMVRSRDTRTACFTPVDQFSDWCERLQLTLEYVQPINVAAHIEALGATRPIKSSFWLA